VGDNMKMSPKAIGIHLNRMAGSGVSWTIKTEIRILLLVMW